MFSTTGGMGYEAAIVFKRLAGMIGNKTGDDYIFHCHGLATDQAVLCTAPLSTAMFARHTCKAYRH